MKKNILFNILLISSLCLTSCYVEAGYNASKKFEETVNILDDNYIINNLGLRPNENKPSIDLFQKRGNDKFNTFYFFLQKKYHPKKKDIDIEIKNSMYKLKTDENLVSFNKIRKSSNGLYYTVENNNLQNHFISDEERDIGLIGGYGYWMEFQEPVKARLLEYIEFDLSITDEEGEIHDYHLHYDITIKPVFKIGSTLWDYLDGH